MSHAFAAFINPLVRLFAPGSVSMPAAVGEAVRYGDGSGVLSPEVAGLVLVVLGLVLILLSVVALVLASKWRIFQKAKQPGWAALVPVYGSVKVLEITSRPLWWVVLLFIPVVNMVVGITLLYRLSLNFGKSGWFTLGLVCLPFIFFPILAFGGAEYKNVFGKVPAMSEAVKWTLIGSLAWSITIILGALMGSSVLRATPLTVISTTSDDGIYATDGAYVYRNDQVIAGADALSFQMIGNYGLDDAHVFLSGEPLVGADVRSFSVLPGGQYAKDAHHEYYTGTIIGGEGVSATLTVYAENNAYAKDNLHVYYYGGIVQGADLVTFAPIAGSEYATDAAHVYYNDTVVHGADPQTFESIDGYLSKDASYDAKDAKHYYQYSDIIK